MFELVEGDLCIEDADPRALARRVAASQVDGLAVRCDLQVAWRHVAAALSALDEVGLPRGSQPLPSAIPVPKVYSGTLYEELRALAVGE